MDRLLGFACSGLVDAVGFHVRSDELKIFLLFFLSFFVCLVSVENSGSPSPAVNSIPHSWCCTFMHGEQFSRVGRSGVTRMD